MRKWGWLAVAASALAAQAMAADVEAARVELGKQLWFDQRLSTDGTVSCNGCHDVMLGGDDDNRPVAPGKKSAPTVWNAAKRAAFNWDGKATTLEEQAKGHFAAPLLTLDAAVSRLQGIPGYTGAFMDGFPGEPHPLSADNLVKALVAFEKTLVTGPSRFDAGKTTPQEKKGYELAQKSGCMKCHAGDQFAGPGVPTWRNVALTAPYFHDGSAPTLTKAVKKEAKELSDADANAVAAFLASLTGERPKITAPQLPPTPGRTAF